jgi:hypothetical protein
MESSTMPVAVALAESLPMAFLILQLLISKVFTLS